MKAPHVKRWTAHAAIMYAADHVSGCNVDAVGEERADVGNVEGAARLCAWALAREVRGPGARERVQFQHAQGRSIAHQIMRQFPDLRTPFPPEAPGPIDALKPTRVR